MIEELDESANQMLQADNTQGSQDSIYECLSVKFNEVKDTYSVEFGEAMKIYVASFPESERRSVAAIKAMLNSGKIRLMIGSIENNIVFMALLYPLKGTSFLLGDYLATDDEYRGRGICSRFLRSIFDIMGDIQFRYLLVQVENPYLDPNEMRTRRMKFYKRLGMKELKGIRFILPPFQGTKPTELILMVLSKEDNDHLASWLVRRIIVQMFEELYGRYEGDEFLVSILEGMPDLIRLD